jgi:hypothetical protein
VICQLPENVNPIEKLLMVLTGDDAEVYFNEVGRAMVGVMLRMVLVLDMGDLKGTSWYQCSQT